ncbi:MAG TPA: hypothetical protein VKA87_06240 [Nitrososphaeraceae archaeon]|nr:hypothetical protein [Nitrososphaeraceae archaeon]
MKIIDITEVFRRIIHFQNWSSRIPNSYHILGSAIFDRPESKRRDSFLLPQTFPEAAPTHPSYSAGQDIP